MKIVGAILNPLFQCDERMIKPGLFTKEKFQAGKKEFLDCMGRLFEQKSEAVVVEDYGTKKKQQVKKDKGYQRRRFTNRDGTQII